MMVNPRFIRLKDAPYYLGMDRNRFNQQVRPYLTTIPIGKQGIAFDRLDLDIWAEEYKRLKGRSKAAPTHRSKLWDEKDKLQAYNNGMACGKSTKKSLDNAFAKALAQATSKRLCKANRNHQASISIWCAS